MGSEWFNDDQQDHMASLAKIPRHERCASGWHVVAEERCDCGPAPVADGSALPPVSPPNEARGWIAENEPAGRREKWVEETAAKFRAGEMPTRAEFENLLHSYDDKRHAIALWRGVADRSAARASVPPVSPHVSAKQHEAMAAEADRVRHFRPVSPPWEQELRQILAQKPLPKGDGSWLLLLVSEALIEIDRLRAALRVGPPPEPGRDVQQALRSAVALGPVVPSDVPEVSGGGPPREPTEEARMDDFLLGELLDDMCGIIADFEQAGSSEAKTLAAELEDTKRKIFSLFRASRGAPQEDGG